MIWICLYAIGIIVCSILLWNYKVKTEGRITICDLVNGIILSLVWCVTAFVVLIVESDNIVIYRRKEKK